MNDSGEEEGLSGDEGSGAESLAHGLGSLTIDNFPAIVVPSERATLADFRYVRSTIYFMYLLLTR